MPGPFCPSDGEGVVRFPSSRRSVELPLTTKPGPGRRLPRSGAERACVPQPLCCWGRAGCACVVGGREQVRCAAGTGGGRAGPEPPPPSSRPPQWSSAGLAAGDWPHFAEMSSTAAYYLLSTLGGYLVTSFLLLKYPTLLHQRKKQRFLSKHISHRGGEGSPEPDGGNGGAFFLCAPLPSPSVLRSSAKGGRVERRPEFEEEWGCVKRGLPRR